MPEVLISGHHENIRKWRREKSLENTLKKTRIVRKCSANENEKTT